MVGRLYVDFTICWELLSGLYYQEFEAMLDASDVAFIDLVGNEGTDWPKQEGWCGLSVTCKSTFQLELWEDGVLVRPHRLDAVDATA